VIDIKNIQKIYFIGIGGIGMSNLARYCHGRNISVSGYDKTHTILTGQLEAEGIAVHYEEDMDQAPKDADVVVYTPAVPKEHRELVYYQQNGYAVIKRSDLLGMITQDSFNICIGGTHGKTTTTTMVAHILRHSGYGCNAFLGGIAANYNSNFWSSENNVCVVEADEYDRSFLKLSPDIAVISSMDADHLDIYGTAEAMEQAFIDFSAKLKPDGLLISRFGLPRGSELVAGRHITYSSNDSAADIYAADIKMAGGGYRFDVISSNSTIKDVELHMGGLHNIENAVAAIAVAADLAIDTEKIKAALAAFKGVKRRFEYIIAPGTESETVMIDDYAHHPEELRALITGAKSLFPGKKCTVVFQPHLYSRTRDHADGFAEVLGLADEVLLLPIYPARELPMEGVSSEMIADRISGGKAICVSKEELLERIDGSEIYGGSRLQLVITAGAGDIDTLVQPIKQILTRRKQ
jgi:UDP-N-acetylmuramate--alanine ligase